MTKRDRPSFLRLVTDKAAASTNVQMPPLPRPHDSSRQTWQPTLFPELNPRLAVAINFDFFSKEGFVNVIERVHPRYIVDLRVLPRFDYLGFNRRVAFDFFARVGSSYFDFTGDVGVSDDRDARLNPAYVTDYIRARVCRSKTANGPLVFLISGHEAEDDYIHMLARHLSTTEAEWQWMKA